MGYQSPQPLLARFWELVERQHGVVSRQQLLALGFSPQGIKRRTASGRLHRARRGVYTVGRPDLTTNGRRMAAVLYCGPHAVLSHRSAGALWEISDEVPGRFEVAVPAGVDRCPRSDIVVHRRAFLPSGDVAVHSGIPVTAPVATLIDLATCLPRHRLEAAINKADELDLIDPEALRVAIDERKGRLGVPVIRQMLDRRTFKLTRSQLERRFLPMARELGLPLPQTRVHVNGFEVDFYWPDLGLVVETDGLRYHRTPAQQARDRLRDQTHTAAGLTPLRFSHAQIRYEPGHVRAIVATVARRLRAADHDA